MIRRPDPNSLLLRIAASISPELVALTLSIVVVVIVALAAQAT